MSSDRQRVRQAVAVFDNSNKLDHARIDIEKLDPEHSDIALFGGRLCFEDEAELAEIGLGSTLVPIFSYEGRLAENFRLAEAGPGVEIKPILQSLISAKQAAFLEEELSAGKTLLWIGVGAAEHEAAICRVC